MQRSQLECAAAEFPRQLTRRAKQLMCGRVAQGEDAAPVSHRHRDQAFAEDPSHQKKLAAPYIACGQDAACVAESAIGITRMDVDAQGNLYIQKLANYVVFMMILNCT